MILAKSYLPVTGNTRYDTWLLFRQTYEIVDECISLQCQLAGITVTAYEALYTVKYGPKPLSGFKLAQLLRRQRHSVDQLARRLEEKGLLIRTTVDGKPSLEITDAGSELVEQITSSGSVEKAFESLDGAHLRQFSHVLNLLREAGLRQLRVVDMGEVEFLEEDDG